MANVFVGISGWAYSGWKPGFYPAKLASAKFLSHYAGRLNSVEVNYTFGRFPTRKLLQGWMGATPAGFKFAIKANRAITHTRRLRDATEATAKLIASLEPLPIADKLGPILFQLPPFLKCDASLLADFLAALPRGVRTAFEFHHPSWFTDEVFAALRKRNAALCLAESETIETPLVQTADFFYLRLRRDAYSAKRLRELEKRVASLAKAGDVFAYFKHEESPKNAKRAVALLKQAIQAAEKVCLSF